MWRLGRYDGGMISLACLAMRTRFEIILADELPPATLRAAGEEALSEIERVEKLLSAFSNDSELYKINAHAAQRAVKVDARVFKLLQEAQTLSKQTDGAFDMTAGALAKCWNLAGMADGSATTFPSVEAIRGALELCGMQQNVELNAASQEVSFVRDGVRLDPGAIGKGWALDRAADGLRESGITSALLHGGTSTVYAIGKPKDGDAWKVAVQDPANTDGRKLASTGRPSSGKLPVILATANLKDASLSVSAVHGKSFTIEGKRYGHVLDPRSGYPVQETVLAAVVHPSGTVSDALSTALLVLGKAGAQGLQKKFPDASYLIAGEDGKVVTWGEAFGK